MFYSGCVLFGSGIIHPSALVALHYVGFLINGWLRISQKLFRTKRSSRVKVGNHREELIYEACVLRASSPSISGLMQNSMW